MTNAATTDWLAEGLAAHDLLPGWRTGIAYYRISDDPEHDELGVRRQRKGVRAKAERERTAPSPTGMDDDPARPTGRKRRLDDERPLPTPPSKRTMAWHPDRMTRGDLDRGRPEFGSTLSAETRARPSSPARPATTT